MRTTLASLLLGSVLFTGGSTPLAAPAQSYPGQPTQGKVWIQNRGTGEAIPISLKEISSDTTMKVLITGTPSVAIATPAVFDARQARQQWQYREVTIGPGQSPVLELTRAGLDGWETTGLQLPGPQGTLIVLKRPLAAQANGR